MEVTGAACRGDALSQHRLRFRGPVGANQGLRGHEVSRSVIGAVFDQDRVFRQGSVKVALLRVLHRKTVAGEGIVWMLRKNIVEGGDAVHKQFSILDS